MDVLIFNGLGTGETRKREQVAFNYLAKRRLEVSHYHVNWRSDESFEVLLDNATRKAQEMLKAKGRLALVGSSAGGSMAINIFSRLQDENVLAVSLCGRLHPGEFSPEDVQSLERRAYLGTPNASQSFYDSVTNCQEIAIPSLQHENLARIAIVKQFVDRVVPRSTMDIPGIEPTIVPGFGHGMGIALGVRALPRILNELEAHL